MESEGEGFRIVVKNLSRDTLTGARIEYALVWRDGVALFFDEESGKWNYTHRSNEARIETVKLRGASDLPDLRFNLETAVETVAAPLERVRYDRNQILGEDRLLGLKLRILDRNGAILHESESGGSEIEAMTWEVVEGLVDSEASRVGRRPPR